MRSSLLADLVRRKFSLLRGRFCLLGNEKDNDTFFNSLDNTFLGGWLLWFGKYLPSDDSFSIFSVSASSLSYSNPVQDSSTWKILS